MIKTRLSLFAKLTALAGAAAVATILVFVVAGNLLFEDARDRHAHRIGSMAQLAVRAILKDPTPQTLRALSDELQISIRYQDARLQFASDESLPAFSELRPAGKRWRRRHHHHRHFPRAFSLARAGGETYLLYRSGEQHAIVSLEHEDTWSLAPLLAAGVLAALLAIWGGTYCLIRRQLAPLAALREDMAAVGAGEWRQCETRRQDEIGMLAQGFNDMQRRLKTTLAARERFLIAASHELRSPIARLKLAAEIIADDKAKVAIRRDLHELEQLTGGLLQNARLQSEHPGLVRQAVQAGDFIRDLLGARPAAEQARCTFAPGGCAEHIINIDRALMARAINNLLDNALKYAERADIVLHAAGGGGLAITVSDNGSGVADKDLPHLFEPFFRADESRTRATGGFGLGLALAAAAAEAHGGRIHAANRPPQGLAVTIQIG